MKIKLKSFHLSFCLSISLILTSFSSFSQKFDINKLPKNSTIYLSSDSLKNLYFNSVEFFLSSKYDLSGNLVDSFGNKYVLKDKKSSMELIENIKLLNYNFFKIEESRSIERYKQKRKELEQRIKFNSNNNEFPIDIIPFGTNPGDDDDGDGVINTEDDDDDNDGILDTDEGLVCEVPLALGVDGDFENFANGAPGDADPGTVLKNHGNADAEARENGKNGSVTGQGWYITGADGSADTWIGDELNPGNARAIPDIGLGAHGGQDADGGGECNGLIPSPQGGVFAGGWVQAGQSEAFRYDVGAGAAPDLGIGKKYVVRFYQAFGGTEGEVTIGDLARWRVNFGGEVWDSPEMDYKGTGNQVWQSPYSGRAGGRFGAIFVF